jgi:hypothetical protein
MARHFSGTAQYLIGSFTPNTGAITLHCVFKCADAVTAMGVVGFFSATKGLYLMTNGNVAGRVFAAINAAVGSLDADSAGAFSTTAWNFATAVYGGSTTIDVVLNGTKTTGTVGTAPTLAATSSGIGCRAFGGSAANLFTGDIAECACWNVQLTTEEVAALHAGVSPLLIRPASLTWSVPLLANYSPEIEVIGRGDMTVTSATAAVHPPIFHPSGVHVFTTKSPVVAGGRMFQVF